MLVDSHCHLDYPDFEEEGLAEVLKRAEEKGVKNFLTISTNISKFEQVLAVAKQFPNVHCTVGTHPHHAAEEPELKFSCQDIIGFTNDDKVVGIGETGLDYFYEYSPQDEQKKSFETHIEAALKTDLPLIVHTRDAETDTIDILRNAGQGKAKAVIHCFSGSLDLAKKSLDLGFYISFSGIITFKKAEELREVVKYVPLDRILVETDCPYLAPIPHRGKRNEPAFVTHTAMCLSGIKDITIDQVEKQTTKNFFDLFAKVKK